MDETNEPIERFDIASWDGPIDAATQARAQTALEAGHVLLMPHLPFTPLPTETRFLTSGAASGGRKNVSFDPATGKLGGAAPEGEEAVALAAMIDRFGRQATTLVSALIPGYASSLERARTSFRPIEARGRPQTPRHDDRRLHLDAFPTRPMKDGRRILRLFSNVATDGSTREWQVGEPFEPFAAQFLPRLRRPLPGASWAQSVLGLTRGKRSRYDEIMMALHDGAKLDEAWQQRAPKFDVSFPAGSTWMVFTDQVLHAALGGRMALEQTFHLPVSALAKPEQAPIRVLERLAGRALA